MLVQLRMYSLKNCNENLGEFDLEKVENDSDPQPQRPLSPGRIVLKKDAIKERNDNKRILRVQKRSAEKSKEMTENYSLAHKFSDHRKKIVHIFKDDDNINALFNGYGSTNSSMASERTVESISSYEQLKKKLGVAYLSYYNAQMKNSLLLLVHSFVNSVLIEINIKHMLLPNTDSTQRRSSLYIHLLRNLKDSPEKIEIIKQLTPLYKTNSSSPNNYQEFFQGLDFASVTDLVESLRSSDNFNSIESYRAFFQYYKSSQHLNYDHSDLIKSVLATNYLQFNNPRVNDTEFLKGLKRNFESFNKNDELRHIDLILGITRTLLTSKSNIPSYGIFKLLLDKLGDLQLYHYQTLVYQTLPRFSHKSTVLNGCKLSALHFQHLIEQTPSILDSLLRYQVPRSDVETLKQMLSFFRLDEVAKHEKVVNRSYLADLMSKSRFFRLQLRQLGIAPVVFASDSPIYVSKETVYLGMRACIELGQFQYLDSLFNKLVVHSVDDAENEALKVVLSFGSRPDKILNQSLMIEDREVVESRIFDNDLFKILIRASRKSDDLGRMMWLMPHLDKYLTSNGEHIDSSLKREIFLALTKFGLEGKVLAYEKMLNFGDM